MSTPTSCVFPFFNSQPRDHDDGISPESCWLRRPIVKHTTVVFSKLFFGMVSFISLEEKSDTVVIFCNGLIFTNLWVITYLKKEREKNLRWSIFNVTRFMMVTLYFVRNFLICHRVRVSARTGGDLAKDFCFYVISTQFIKSHRLILHSTFMYSGWAALILCMLFTYYYYYYCFMLWWCRSCERQCWLLFLFFVVI